MEGTESDLPGWSTNGSLAWIIAYSFQSLAPTVNSLRPLSITYTYSQQLSGRRPTCQARLKDQGFS
jgi:hypothetical protein